MIAPKDRWLDREAGPVVRPYAVTKGRTVPARNGPGLIDVVAAVTAEPRPPNGVRLAPSTGRSWPCASGPAPLADLASDVDLPVGVVRVLLSDLSQYGMLQVLPAARGQVTNERLLRDVLDGLHAL